MADLQTFRSQLQFVRAQHGGRVSDVDRPTDGWYTDATGATNATFTTTFMYGRILLAIPSNPYTGVNTVTIVTTAWAAPIVMTTGGGTTSDTGQFQCYVPDTVLTTNGTQVNAL